MWPSRAPHGASARLRVCAILLCAWAAVPAMPLAAQQGAAPPARTCQIYVDSAPGGTQILRVPDGTQNVYSGGGVWARCLNQSTTVTSDSMAYTQATGLLILVGRVHFRDSTAILDADKVTYWLRQERLFAEGRVYTRNLASGSEMRGPNLNYYRAAPPIRDTLELYAIGRPTIRFHAARDSVRADTANPFIIVADRVRMKHTDMMWGSGHVTIDRIDLHAKADSALLNLADSVGILIGAPEVIGRDTARARTDTAASYRLVGQRIRFELDAQQKIRHVLSMGDADARGPDWHLTADTLDMALDSGRIRRAQAWGRESRPVAVSGLSHISADSLDIQMPEQLMRLVWAYGQSRATSRPDSTMVEDDWLSGDSLRANFALVDSAGRKRSEIERVTAFGTARAYYHTDNEHDPHGERGISYSRGDRIQIAMREGKVRTVDIVGRVDGILLEPLPPGSDTIAADTSRAAGPRRASAPAPRPR